MPDSMFFLSYSREQLYFAESLVLQLQAAGLRIWFDLQQLTPGSDWKAGIECGLRDCDGLILLASKASLSSSYVQREWETVCSTGRPIFLVWVESVSLPSHLRPTASVDLSDNFNVTRLKECLCGESHYHDLSPTHGRLPQSVREVSHELMVNSLLLLYPGISYIFLPFKMGWLGVGILTGSLGLFSLRYRLRLHQAHYNRLVQVFAILAVFWWLVVPWDLLFTVYLVNEITLSKLGWLHWVTMIVVATRGHSSGMIARSQLIDTETLYRWLPKGTLSIRQREIFEGLRSRDILVKTSHNKLAMPCPSPIRYALHCSDKRLSHTLRQRMVQAGHILSETKADYTILVLNKQTLPDTVAQIIASSAPFIPILADNIDILNRFPDLGAYQIIDYRRREPETLTILAYYLGSPAERSQILGLSLTPEQFSRRVLPSPATLLARLVGAEHLYAFVVLCILSLLLAYLLTFIL